MDKASPAERRPSDADVLGIPADLRRHLAPFAQLQFRHGGFGLARDPRPDPDARKSVTQRQGLDLQSTALAEVVLFGKVHYLTRQEYSKRARRLAEALWRERGLLYSQIASTQKIDKEWRGEHATSPLEARFDGLMRVLDALPDLRKNPQPLKVGAFGVVLHQVRTRHAVLAMRANADRERAIENANTGEKVATLIKDTAFLALHKLIVKALGLTPAGSTLHVEFGARIAFVIVEAGAISAGAKIAGTHWEREAFAVVKARLPEVIVDAFMKVSLTQISEEQQAKRALAITLIEQLLELAFEVVIIGSEGGFSGDNWEETLIGLVESRVTTAVVAFLSGYLGGKFGNEMIAKLVRQVILGVVQVLGTETRAIYELAKERNVPFGEVFVPEVPWLIAKVFQAVILGMLDEASAQHVKPKTRDLDAVRRRRGPAHEALVGIYRQARSARLIFREPESRPEVHRPRPSGLVKMEHPNWESYDREWWRELKLVRVHTHQMLKFIDDGATIIEFRIGKEAAARNATEPGVVFKHGGIKSKTADDGPGAGFLHAPARPPGGEPFAPSSDWAKDLEVLSREGCLVRRDRRVIHPDLVIEWAKSQPDRDLVFEAAEHARAWAAAQRARVEASGATGADRTTLLDASLDLGSDSFARYIADKMGDKAPGALRRLDAALVGITGDLDHVGVWDTPTDARILLSEEVSLPDGTTMSQGREAIIAYDNATNPYAKVEHHLKTKFAREGRRLAPHGPADQLVDRFGMLVHSKLGPVAGLARHGDRAVRWIVDFKRGVLSVPNSMVGHFKHLGGSPVSTGEHSTLSLGTVQEKIATARRILSTPPVDPVRAREAVLELGLSHLDGETRQRFVDRIQELARSAKNDERASVEVHLTDAATLSLLHDIRKIHSKDNKKLLDAHRRLRDAIRAREVAEDRTDAVTELEPAAWAERPRIPPGQITEQPPERGRGISQRAVEASLLARGLVLLAPENGSSFQRLASGVELEALARWLDRKKLVIGANPSGSRLVVARFEGEAASGDEHAFDALMDLFAFAEAYRARLVGAEVWWEIYRSVLPNTSSHVRGRLDPLTFTPAPPNASSPSLSCLAPRPDWVLLTLRAEKTMRSYPGAAAPERAFSCLRLDAVWQNGRSAAVDPREVTLDGRPVSVFLGPPISVPNNGPRVTRPLEASRADLDSVAGWQRALRDLGWLRKEPDGRVDAETREALALFQMVQEPPLRVDGEYGPKTRAALGDALLDLELAAGAQ